jgi:hypothetical protein
VAPNRETLDWLGLVTNNDPVLRTLTALALAFVVPLGAVCTPLVHAHLDDHATEHHRVRSTVHAHFDGHARKSVPHHHAALGANETERTLYLQLFVAVAVASFQFTTAAATFELATPDETPAHRSVHVVHGHDPPIVATLPARAPPSFLS